MLSRSLASFSAWFTLSWEELQHAEALQRLLRNFVMEELGDVRTAFFRLAAGQIGKSSFRPEAMARLRQEMSSFMEDPGLSLQIPELNMLAQSLRALGDPDWAILMQGPEGVALGLKTPLPRVPQLFRNRTRFRRLDDSPYNPLMANYESAEISAEQLEEHFKADKMVGRMYPSTESSIIQEFGKDSLLIAAMGAIIKPSGEIRPFMMTHGVDLNNQIRVLDKLEVPGPEEVMEVVAWAKESGDD